MKRNVVILLFFGFAVALLPCPASSATSVDEQVKKLAQRYSEVEGQLDRSVRYANRDDKEDSEQAWFNGSDDLIKLAAESWNGTERQLTEYFALDFENDYDGMFMIMRKETPAPDGGVQVEESRKYFGEGKNGGNGILIRELRKSARSKPGEPTDTVHTPNVVVDVTKKANQPTEDQLRQILNTPTKMAEELRKGAPELDPFANVKGDSDKYRVIHGTTSPDGRFAIALGSADEDIGWDSFVDHDFQRNRRPTLWRTTRTFAITLLIWLKREFWVRRARPSLERVAVTIIRNVLLHGLPIRVSSCSCSLTNGHRMIALREESQMAPSSLARSI
jgi:hypothetical protein